MNKHIYEEKIINCSKITKEEKQDYINNLVFNSNKIMLKNKIDLNQFYEDFNSIIFNTKKLYVYLNMQDCENSNIDYMQHYYNAIKDINIIFGEKNVILQNTRFFTLNKKKIIRCFLVYCEDSNIKEIFEQDQLKVKNELCEFNLTIWNIRSLLSQIHQMNLYKMLYFDLFKDITEKKISHFIDAQKNGLQNNIGIIKNEKKNENFIQYHINQFNIIYDNTSFPDSPITFTFNIITKVFRLSDKSVILTNINLYDDNHLTQMVILENVIPIKNKYDKKSISFNVNKYQYSKFYLYCMCIDIFKKDNSIIIINGRLVDSKPICENEQFFKRNIDKKLNIGFVYEVHLENKIDEYKTDFYNMLYKELKWRYPDNIDLIDIRLDENLEINSIVEILNNSRCDCFICLTDVYNYEENKDLEINDYYKKIKNFILQQKFKNEKPLIVQGIIINSEENNEDENEEDENKNFKDKIKISFFDLCSKYIFYNNELKFNSSFEESSYALIAFDSKNKLCSFIKFSTHNKVINIEQKELCSVCSENAKELKDDIVLKDFLSKKIDNYFDFLKKVTLYDDFIIYDFKEKTFLLSSKNKLYLLSDDRFSLREEYILNYRKGRKNKGKESKFIMSPLMPLYNISRSFDSQIFIFELNNEKYYLVANDKNKCKEHPQSPLTKIYMNKSNDRLMDLYFKGINLNIIRNNLNAKITLFEKFSTIHMIN